MSHRGQSFSLRSLLLLLLFSPSSIAQENTTNVINNDKIIHKKPSQEIVSYYDNLIIRPFINGSSEDLDVKYFSGDDNDTSKSIEYRPAIVTNLGIGLSYKWFGFSVSVKSDSVPDKNKYGESKYFDLQLFSYWRQIGLDFYLADYSGYYLDNNSDFDLNRGDPETILPDLTTNTIGANIIYSFSKNYSLRAAFKQTERQEQSSGSFMLMTSIKRFSIENDSSLIPASEEKNFFNDTGYEGGEYWSVGIAPGYGYTLRVWKFSISGSLFIGTGIMSINYDVASGQKEKTQSYLKSNLKLCATLDVENYFCGIRSSYDAVASETFIIPPSGVSTSVSNIYVELFFGYRFGF